MLWVTSFVGLFSAGLLVYALCFEAPYLSYQNLPFPLTVEKVIAGNAAPLSVERCNNSKQKQTYETTRRLVRVTDDGLKDIILGSRKVDIKPGCHRGISKISEVPKDTPPGLWQLNGTALVMGLLVVHEVEWYSEPFEVSQ